MNDRPRPARRAIQIIVGALALNLLSLAIASTRSAGMGTHTSRGFPRPFYFTRTGIESGGSSGVNWLYFVENWLIYAVALAAIAALIYAIRTARTGKGTGNDVARP